MFIIVLFKPNTEMRDGVFAVSNYLDIVTILCQTVLLFLQPFNWFFQRLFLQVDLKLQQHQQILISGMIV